MGATLHRRPEDALATIAGPQEKVLLVGLDDVADRAWAPLEAAGLGLLRAASTGAALRLLAERAAQVVIADPRGGPELTRAVRARRDVAGVHIVVCARPDSPHDLRDALDAGADDVMRIPFEPEVLVARVAAGLRAVRLRAHEARLASLVGNIPGAVYRCACDRIWTMEWISAEIERIVGYPPSDFIDNAVRNFASVTHPDDVEGVEVAVFAAADNGRPYGLEYRLVHADGSIRWVLERGQVLEAEDGRRWLDGVIFDITARREAEDALREHAVMQAQLAEVVASRTRILEAADRARRAIERDLHDGAQQRFVSLALRLQVGWPRIATCPRRRRPTCARSSRSCAPASGTCASSRAACTRASSAPTGSSTRCARSAPAAPCPSTWSSSSRGSASPRASSPPPTSWSARP